MIADKALHEAYREISAAIRIGNLNVNRDRITFHFHDKGKDESFEVIISKIKKHNRQ